MQRTAHRHAQRTPIARPTDRSRGGGAEREYVCACAAHRVPHHAADIRVQRRFASHVWLGARRMTGIFEKIKAVEATRGKYRKRPPSAEMPVLTIPIRTRFIVLSPRI